jgi:hypothetical protein
MKLSSDLHPMFSLRIVGLYLRSSIRLHSVLLNSARVTNLLEMKNFVEKDHLVDTD